MSVFTRCISWLSQKKAKSDANLLAGVLKHGHGSHEQAKHNPSVAHGAAAMHVQHPISPRGGSAG